MAIDVTEIQSRIASLVDQTVDTPTAGGAEWNLRLKYVNRAIEEWGQAFDWESLRRTYWPSVTGVSQASISLPTDFRKMAGFPRYHSGGVSGGEEWNEVKPEEIGLYVSSDKYFYVLGNRAEGHTMVWNPGTMTSGASLVISYYSFATSLSSPANTIVMADPEFIVHRVAAYIFESRSDARFQETETKARETLLQMIENDQVAKYASYGAGTDKNVQTDDRLFHSFRIGRD